MAGPPDGDSVLAVLESRGDPAPRLRLEEPEAPALEEIPLRRSAHYQVLSKIAAGGVGEVHRGRDVDLGRDVALKFLHAHHLGNSEIVRRFVEEAQVGGQLQHPGIVPVYELGLQADRRPFFAMKLVRGVTLTERLAAGADDRRAVLKVLEQVTQAVAYAHSRGVVHRDLKPANVMIGAFGEVQVVDWGFAKLLAQGGVADERRARRSAEEAAVVTTVRSGSGGSTSVAGEILGTPAYMPPEQALGSIDELDERADVFALGAILAEILTGKPPYQGTPMEILSQAAEGRVEPAIERLESCGAAAELVALARACLAPVPGDRPRDAGVVAERLSAHLAAVEQREQRSRVEAVEARARSEEATARAEAQRRARCQIRLLAAAGVLVILVSVGGILWLKGVNDSRRAETARQVSAALREATERGGERAWVAARAAAERAREIAGAGEADAATRHRADEVLAQIVSEEEAARQVEERSREDRILIEKLDSIRHLAGPRQNAAVMDGLFLQAFREWGVDLEKDPVERSGAELAASSEPEALAAVLDEWSWRRRTKLKLQEGDWHQLVAIASLADPDPWRTRLREAAAARDLEALHGLTVEALGTALPAPTFSLLASSLKESGDRPAAAVILRHAVRIHPGDFWLQCILSRILTEIAPPCWEEAARHGLAAMALRPESPWVMARTGQFLVRTGDREAALERLAEAHRRATGDVLELLDVAHGYRAMGEPDRAIAAFEEVLRLDDRSVLAWMGIGQSRSEKGDGDGAIRAYEEILHLDPRHGDATNNIGFEWWRRNELDRALEFYRKAAEIEPALAVSYANQAVVLSQTGKTEEAAVVAQRAIELDPQMSTAHLILGRILRDRNEVEKALEHFMAAAASQTYEGPGAANLYVQIANTHMFYRNDPQAALEPLRLALQIDPRNCHALDHLGCALIDLGRIDEGLTELERAISFEPSYANSRANRAWVLADHRERHADALEEIDRALALRPGFPPFLSNKAWILATCPDEALCDPAMAVELAERAVGGLPNVPSFLGTLGTARYRAGDLEGAASTLARVLEAGSREPENYLVLSMVRWRLGDRDEARRLRAVAEEHMADGNPSRTRYRLRDEADSLLGSGD